MSIFKKLKKKLFPNKYLLKNILSSVLSNHSALEARNSVLEKKLQQMEEQNGLLARQVNEMHDSMRLFKIDVVDYLKEWYPDLTKFIHNNKHKSHSQLLQDLWVLYELQSKENGFFVEFGACDGITLSNTYLLEKEYKWKGILCEALPSWLDELTSNRRVHIDRRCVWSSSNEVLTFAMPAYKEISGVLLTGLSDEHAADRKTAKTIQVKTVSLTQLLDDYQAPRDVDYISIDTEGSELLILEAFDFEKYNVKLFSIEHNYNEHNRCSIHTLMTSKGYSRRFKLLSQWDDWYYRSEIPPPKV